MYVFKCLHSNRGKNIYFETSNPFILAILLFANNTCQFLSGLNKSIVYSENIQTPQFLHTFIILI